ncbi:MAG TPA: biopolymer transporter ExbD [Thermosulfurimonas dismutans]|uniref:Biopolymer transporter ExbD n=1 Tax=Thermosulfurimonas dismutans TaxID=999894 RepID=A0A7C3CX48_9BACT|nr:biopolymer transporter ExbD [Thermosulfurimonas dismutans]
MLRLKKRPRPAVTLPLTALIDIVFLLLIYFLLTSSFIHREGLNLSLPRALSGKTVKAPLTIYVDRNGTIYFEKKRTRAEELVEVLSRRLATRQEKKVMVEADRRAPLEAVVSAMDAARLAGAKTLSLATEKPRAP